MNLASAAPNAPRLDRKDRNMLLVILGLVAVFLIVLALFTPARDPNNNTVPDSYLAGQHGAKAAYTLLQQNGYAVVRWEEPLGNLARRADSGTVLVLAEPVSLDRQDRYSIAEILHRSGRVLATGFQGGSLLPGNAVSFSGQMSFAACESQPDGISPLAGAGPIWIAPRATWRERSPEVHTAYTCAGQPVVVEYPVGTGHAVWWASSTPLENGSIARGQNLELLLNSIGPARPQQGQRIYWDESLHGQTHSSWDYTTGPLWTLLWTGTLGLALLILLSYSRRSGPVRPLPQSPRTTPIEFLDALGGLYRATGAASTALQIAWERFRNQTALLAGQRIRPPRGQAHSEPGAKEIAAAIQRRFGSACEGMETDLVAAEEACWNDKLKPRRALVLIRALRRHEETLRAVSSLGSSATHRVSDATPAS